MGAVCSNIRNLKHFSMKIIWITTSIFSKEMWFIALLDSPLNLVHYFEERLKQMALISTTSWSTNTISDLPSQ